MPGFLSRARSDLTWEEHVTEKGYNAAPAP